MTNPAKNKGDRGEREAAAILSDLLGVKAERLLGAGRKADVGDIFGVPDTVIQVADWKDVSAAALQKPRDAESQRGHAGATFAVSMVRFKGGQWRVVMTPSQFATLWREATG